jgi:hypothetical protein
MDFCCLKGDAMFHEWDSFFLLIGSAAGALIGLLFVVVTLTDRLDRTHAQRGAAVYMTPTVFHFAFVMLVSALAFTPNLSVKVTAFLLGAGAVIGVAYTTMVCLQFRAERIVPSEAPHWSDVWCYGVVPLAIYLCLLAASAAVWVDARFADHAVAATALALLLIAIRNSWDMVTWLAPHGDTES